MSAISPIPISTFDQNRHLGYPHNNCFCDGGQTLVLSEIAQDARKLIRHDLSSGKESLIYEIPNRPDETPNGLWFDIALQRNLLVFVDDNVVWQLDLDGSSKPVAVHKNIDWMLESIATIRPDGKTCLLLRHAGDRYEVLECDLESGAVRTLIYKEWWVGHAHYCPHDPSWIGICHEGLCENTPDRVWAYHESKAPGAICLFAPPWEIEEERLFAGHERWCFHASTALVVCYGVSPGSPRGIYELDPATRENRLVSEGDRDWHVNIDRIGRWAVVDTTGAFDQPGKGWENARNRSDIVLIDMQTGRRQFVAQSRHANHPSHPHPAFSPDSRWVIYNEIDESFKANRVMKVNIESLIA